MEGEKSHPTPLHNTVQCTRAQRQDSRWFLQITSGKIEITAAQQQQHREGEKETGFHSMCDVTHHLH